MTGTAQSAHAKVPAATLGFWIIKVAATTLGETGGDALSMTLHFGYANSSLIFFAVFAVAVAAQIGARSFHVYLYWTVIVATTTPAPQWPILRTVRSASAISADR